MKERGFITRRGLFVFVAVALIIGSTVLAQPTIPKGRIPTDIAADVREQIERLYSDHPVERASATFWLSKMGERAVPAIPFIIAILPEYNETQCTSISCDYHVFPGEEAAKALVTLGEFSVEPLIGALKDENVDIRRMATSILGQIKDPRAVDSLVATLEDEHRNVRMMAAWSLAQIGEPAVKPLINVLRMGRSSARGDVAWALGKIGDQRAVEPLIHAMQEEEPTLQSDAAQALAKITGHDFGVDPTKWREWWEKNRNDLGA
jgi:bilin biosynthesis protein